MYTSTSFASVAEADSMEGFFWPRDRFYDRAGRAISIAHWAKLRGDCEYRTIGDWCDGNGSVVRTVWTGFGFNYGHSESLIFETHSIVGGEALFYTYCTEADARRGHGEAVWRISTGPGQGDEFATPPGVTIGAVQSASFFDREGNSITLAQWARLRRDPPSGLRSGREAAKPRGPRAVPRRRQRTPSHSIFGSQIDGSALRYNQADPLLPDLLVCVPRYADAVLAVLR